MTEDKILKLLTGVVKHLYNNDKLQYEYRLISATEIIEGKTDLLDRQVNPRAVVGDRRVEIRRVYQNRNIIGEYLTEVSRKGWELVSTFEYSGVPYGGALVFRKLVTDVEEFDLSEVENIFFQPIEKDIEELADEFEEKYPDKKAIWKNRLTNDFKKYINTYSEEKENV